MHASDESKRRGGARTHGGRPTPVSESSSALSHPFSVPDVQKPAVYGQLNKGSDLVTPVVVQRRAILVHRYDDVKFVLASDKFSRREARSWDHVNISGT